MREYPKPKTLRQLQRFLGMASWYRKFIKDFAAIANPLTKLLKRKDKNNNRLEWGAEQDKAFDIIKDK